MDEDRRAVVLMRDDPQTAALVRGSLEREGYQGDTVADRRAALRALDTAWPDLLLLDAMLPELDEFEVCTRVRESYWKAPYLPVLMLTAHDAAMHAGLGYPCGPDDYLPQPVDRDHSCARVREWGEASRRVRELHRARA